MNKRDIDREMDDVLNAARIPDGPAPQTLERIAVRLRTSMRPVRPLPPAWLLIAVLLLVCAAVALLGAARGGFFGFEKMTAFQGVLVFAALGLFAWAAASESVLAVIPGSRRRFSTAAMLCFGCGALLAVFAAAFREREVTHFFAAGVVCLAIGLLHALPAGLLGWLVLRRGFAVQPVSAGLATGTLAGLAGVGMLELHCPNFQAAHALVWHTAVIPLSAALGALIAGIGSRARRASS